MARPGMTTIQIDLHIRRILEVLQSRYGSSSVNMALHSYFDENDPRLVEGAEQIERILRRQNEES